MSLIRGLAIGGHLPEPEPEPAAPATPHGMIWINVRHAPQHGGIDTLIQRDEDTGEDGYPLHWMEHGITYVRQNMFTDKGTRIYLLPRATYGLEGASIQMMTTSELPLPSWASSSPPYAAPHVMEHFNVEDAEDEEGDSGPYGVLPALQELDLPYGPPPPHRLDPGNVTFGVTFAEMAEAGKAMDQSMREFADAVRASMADQTSVHDEDGHGQESPEQETTVTCGESTPASGIWSSIVGAIKEAKVNGWKL